MSEMIYDSGNRQIAVSNVAGAVRPSVSYATPLAQEMQAKPFNFPYFPPALEKMGLASGTTLGDIYKQQKFKFILMESGKAKTLISAAAFLALLTTKLYWLSPVAAYFMLEGYRDFRIGELKYNSHNKRPIIVSDTPLLPSYRK